MAKANENHTAFNVIQTSKVHQKVGPLEFCFSVEFSNEIKLMHRQWESRLDFKFWNVFVHKHGATRAPPQSSAVPFRHLSKPIPFTHTLNGALSPYKIEL